MSYEPCIESSTIPVLPKLNNYPVFLHSDITSPGLVNYHLILEVRDLFLRESVLFITSEVNNSPSGEGDEPHYLCMFINGKHTNMGASDDWGDKDKFIAEAQDLVIEALEASHAEMEEAAKKILAEVLESEGSEYAQVYQGGGLSRRVQNRAWTFPDLWDYK